MIAPKMVDYRRDIFKKFEGGSGVLSSAVPPMGSKGASRSESRQDVKKIILLINGDYRFKGKVFLVNPGNYSSFKDFLSELNSILPLEASFRNKIGRIFTPRGRHRIVTVEDFVDGGYYICAGTEPIQSVMKSNAKLTKGSMDPFPSRASKLKPTSKLQTSENMLTGELPNLKPPTHIGQYSRPSLKYMSYIYAGVNRLGPLPNKNYGIGQLNTDRTQKLSGTLQILSTDGKFQGSRNVIIVRSNPDGIGRTALHVVMSRRAVHTLGQVLCKISEAFGSRWHHDPIRHLYFLNGREVRSINELFRKDKVYIASGFAKMFGTNASNKALYGSENKTQTQTQSMALTVENIKTIISEFWPDHPEPSSVIYQWERRLARTQGCQKESHDVRGTMINSTDVKQAGMSSPYDLQIRPRIKGTSASDDDKRDSGFEESSMMPKLSEQSNRQEKEDESDITKCIDRISHKQPDVLNSKLSVILQENEKSAEKQKVNTLRPRYKKMYYSDVIVKNEAKLPLGSSTNYPTTNSVIGQSTKTRILDSAWSQKIAKWQDRSDIGKRIVTQTIERREDLLKENQSPSDNGAQHRLFKCGYNHNQQPLAVVDETKEDQSHLTAVSNIKSIKKLESNVATSSKFVDTNEHAAAHKSMKLGDLKETPSSLNDSTGMMGLKSKEINSETKKLSTDETRSQSIRGLSESGTSLKQEPISNLSEDAPTDKPNDSKEDRWLHSKPNLSANLVRRHSAVRTIFTKIGVCFVADPEFLLKRFHIGRTVGDGNFAVVKLARRRDTGNQYAIKIIDKAKIKGKENMLLNEITIMHRCEHPNIVHLFEEFETPKEIWLSMEFVKDGDLFDGIIQARKFTEPIAAGIVSDMADALFYLHSRFIVHRDLKPENVLLIRQKTGRIRVKLADFGLALEVKQNLFTVCGTPTYIAPEILAETGYGLEVDMWALGIITYILLCGFAPFRSPEKRQSKLFELIKKGVFEYISPYWDNISPGAKDLIDKLLVVDRKQRLSALDTLIHPWVYGLGNANLTSQAEQKRLEYRLELEKQAKSLANQHNPKNRSINTISKTVDSRIIGLTQLPTLTRSRVESIPLQKNINRTGNSMLVSLPSVTKRMNNDQMKSVNYPLEK